VLVGCHTVFPFVQTLCKVEIRWHVLSPSLQWGHPEPSSSFANYTLAFSDGGENSTMTCCRNCCKCHNAPQYNNMIPKNTDPHLIKVIMKNILFIISVNIKYTHVLSQVPVAHACNPSYSGGRDQEDRGLKPAEANSSWDSILKNLNQKRAGGVTQVLAHLPNECEALSSNSSDTHTHTYVYIHTYTFSVTTQQCNSTADFKDEHPQQKGTVFHAQVPTTPVTLPYSSHSIFMSGSLVSLPTRAGSLGCSVHSCIPGS
jgi:hypothetical protein